MSFCGRQTLHIELVSVLEPHGLRSIVTLDLLCKEMVGESLLCLSTV